jgi:hypothetical protein
MNVQNTLKQTKSHFSLSFTSSGCARGALDVVLIALHNFSDFSAVITERNFSTLSFVVSRSLFGANQQI